MNDKQNEVYSIPYNQNDILQYFTIIQDQRKTGFGVRFDDASAQKEKNFWYVGLQGQKIHYQFNGKKNQEGDFDLGELYDSMEFEEQIPIYAFKKNLPEPLDYDKYNGCYLAIETSISVTQLYYVHRNKKELVPLDQSGSNAVKVAFILAEREKTIACEPGARKINATPRVLNVIKENAGPSYQPEAGIFSLRKNGEIKKRIFFTDVVGDMDLNFKQYKKLKKFYTRFNGLCELISNYVMIHDLMGKKTALNTHQFSMVKDGTQIKLEQKMPLNEYKQKLRFLPLNTKPIRKSHIIDVFSFIDKFFAFFFNQYPFNLFSKKDPFTQETLDANAMKKTFDELPVDGYVKVFIFNKSLFGFEGHSMLIKKTADKTYTFFDPNQGEIYDLNLGTCLEEVKKAMEKHKFEETVFLDGKQYLEHLYKERIVPQPIPPLEEEPALKPHA